MALHGGAGRGESLVICYLGDSGSDPYSQSRTHCPVALSIAKLWGEKRETEQ